MQYKLNTNEQFLITSGNTSVDVFGLGSSKQDKLTGTSSQVVKGDGTYESGENYVKYAESNYLFPENFGLWAKSRTFNATGWFRVFRGAISPIHLMLTRNYYSPAPEGYDIDIDTVDLTVTDDLWGVATITQNSGYFNSTGAQEIQKIRVYGFNGAPETSPNNPNKARICIDVYIEDKYPAGANTYYVAGYSLTRSSVNSFYNYSELTQDDLEYVQFCQNKGNAKYYSEFNLVDGFKTNKSVRGVSFIKDGGTSSQYLKADGSVSTLTFDTTPTSGSSNPITSGAVYDALGDIETLLASI